MSLRSRIIASSASSATTKATAGGSARSSGSAITLKIFITAKQRGGGRRSGRDKRRPIACSGIHTDRQHFPGGSLVALERDLLPDHLVEIVQGLVGDSLSDRVGRRCQRAAKEQVPDHEGVERPGGPARQALPKRAGRDIPFS